MIGYFFILGFIVFVFIVFYMKGQKELFMQIFQGAIEELAALEKHSIRYWLTPVEKERLAYLKAWIEENAPKPAYRGSALGAATMIGLAGYTIYQGQKDAERCARDVSPPWKG
jgi:hypothetical protein